MIQQVKAFIEKHQLLTHGSCLVAACSGGPDSLALVHILAQLRSDYGMHLVVAHVDHMFRGQESAEEAVFVELFCQQHDIPCHRTALDVPAFIAASGLSGQEAARILRYRYLREVAAAVGAASIATGHHQDDQAETVLLHLLRGAGGDGLQGMKPRNEDIIRPLLGISRVDIEAYCEQSALQPRYDSSNAKPEYLRNAIRLELLPHLMQRYNPAIKEGLCRTAAIIGEQQAYVRSEAERLWAAVAVEEADGILLQPQLFSNQHKALQREIIRLAIEKKCGNLTGIGFDHIEQIIELLIAGRTGAKVELPKGFYGYKTYGGVELRSGQTSATVKDIDLPETQLILPGITKITQLGLAFSARIGQDRNGGPAEGRSALFDLDQLLLPLYVRGRRPGDRFRPLGMTGTKKVKDFLIDVKLERAQRNRLPIVCDAAGTIIWLAGLRQAEQGKITRHTRNFLCLTIENQGEQNGENDETGCRESAVKR